MEKVSYFSNADEMYIVF